MYRQVLTVFVLTGIATAQDVSYIDLLSPYKETNGISENRIGYGKTYIVSTPYLYGTRRQFYDLKKLVETQSQMLTKLITGQKKLIRDRSRHGKWNKNIRKYMKKIYQSCTCKSRENRGEYHVRPVNSATGAVADMPFKGDYSGRTVNNASAFKLHEPQNKKEVVEVELNEDRKAWTGHKVHNLDLLGQSYSEDVQVPSTVNLSTASTTKSQTTTVTPHITSASSASSGWQRPNDDSDNSEGFFDVVVNLDTGTITGNHSDITWLNYPTDEQPSHCGRQGLVRLNFFDPSTNQSHDKMKIDLWFDTPQDWVFNVGDSKLNDGGSGDGTTQQNDCEAQGYGTTFSVHASDKSTNPYKKVLYEDKHFIKSRLTLIVSNESIVWNNHDGNFNYLRSPALFALNNQSDNQGHIDFNLYLSFNRVIAGNYRSGRGLCKVALKWLD